MNAKILARQLVCLSNRRTVSRLPKFVVNQNWLNVRPLCTSSDGKLSFQDTLKKMKKDAENVDNGGNVENVKVESAEPIVNADGNAAENDNKETKADEPSQPFSWSVFASKLGELSNSAVTSVKDIFASDANANAYKMPEVEKSYLRRKIHQALTFTQTGEVPEGVEKYDGPTSMVWIKDPLSPWESMKARMAASPVIRDLLKRSFKVQQAASATDVGKKFIVANAAVQDKIDDMREYWETTQNPVVYSLAGAWENVTGETEEGQCIRDFQKLDPHFSKEEWAVEVKNDLVPAVIQAHLTGSVTQYRHLMGEAVYNKLLADIRIRKQEGLVFDPTVIEVEERQVSMKYPEGSDSAYIIGHYAVQQLYCVKNREGEIVEGGESDIRMRIYTFLFQQALEEVPTGMKTPSGAPVNEHYMVWKIMDYQFGEMIPYL